MSGFPKFGFADGYMAAFMLMRPPGDDAHLLWVIVWWVAALLSAVNLLRVARWAYRRLVA